MYPEKCSKKLKNAQKQIFYYFQFIFTAEVFDIVDKDFQCFNIQIYCSSLLKSGFLWIRNI